MHSDGAVVAGPGALRRALLSSAPRFYLSHLARRLDVRLVPERLRTEPKDRSSLHINGEFIPLDKWEGHSSNPHPDGLRHLAPWQIIFSFLNSRLAEMDLDGWRSVANAHLDIPVAGYLASQGLNDETIRLADKFSSYGTNLWQSSLLQFAHVFSFMRVSMQLAHGKSSMSVDGGNQRMPEAMAGALKGDVLAGRHVPPCTWVAMAWKSDASTGRFIAASTW